MIRNNRILSPRSPPDAFPDPKHALTDPNGLLAVGGDLEPARLLFAYRNGIFPWYSEGEPILWWSPDPRMVLFPQEMKVSRSLRKTLRRGHLRVTYDRCFPTVMRECAAPRADGRGGRDSGTWITREMLEAYIRLHELGYARSVECWEGENLVGGLYGVAIGRVFFGESMFSRVSDASKVALVDLCRQDYGLIDCQVPSEHLMRLGAKGILRDAFRILLSGLCD
uniref:Leucyl/phenylalanyl-tRNA--protein transferase n=1 Tax=Candidatus Kentrum sp. LPFa TaxID=2126335 RepID=A0A450VZK7_9GAMM|nr:MAG: leucyl/phenylalanyl-tRNA--protein transferase [Candidatus Kentron sp. LPFa]VFK26263.1 MAG: leucyl/phenylalanyl-tRNA--protein transferase [Candidatus Kentron sp. LPFa]